MERERGLKKRGVESANASFIGSPRVYRTHREHFIKKEKERKTHNNTNPRANVKRKGFLNSFCPSLLQQLKSGKKRREKMVVIDTEPTEATAARLEWGGCGCLGQRVVPHNPLPAPMHVDC